MMINFFYYVSGLLILILNKIRYTIFGYKKPKDFSINDIGRAIDYDIKVIESWLDFFEKYIGTKSFRNKNILELGPGSDLGVGLILLSKGVKKYNAFDVNNLVKSAPEKFYEKLFLEIKKINKSVDIDCLKEQLGLVDHNKNDKLNYIVNKKFELSNFKNEKIDLVLSHAAFEHFSDTNKSVKELSKIVKSGAILITRIDMQTHAGCLRNRDPLNIYRYSEFIYDFLKFSGSPNRLRAIDYKEILEKNGWEDVKVFPLDSLEKRKFKKVEKYLNKKFIRSNKQVDQLEVVICAKKR